MGHDILGYKTTDKESEIAYLRRGAFNPLKNEIYKALECEDCNGGVSGIGIEKQFNKDELLKALEYIGDNQDLDLERCFLEDCLKNLDENNNILISFW